MSVLIKGMEKPEHCGYCRFRYDGICHALQRTQYSMDECPLIGIDEDVIKSLPSAQPEAKPPKWVAEDRYVKNRFAVFPHCPQCYAEVTTGQCYCMICGQHIDWSEDDG